MSNKNIAILTIGMVLAIAVLVLAILKGNDMWKWVKEKCCCVGSKKVEVAEDANNYGSIDSQKGSQNNDTYPMLVEAAKEFLDVTENQWSRMNLYERTLYYQDLSKKFDNKFQIEKEERDKERELKNEEDKKRLDQTWDNVTKSFCNVFKIDKSDLVSDSRRSSDSGHNSDIE